MLQQHKHIGFAIARKDIVKELAIRFQSTFINAKVTAVYGGNTQELSGDLIVLTTHQLFRYEHCFDLLVIDEVDAFPFANNEELHIQSQKAAKAFVFLSATPPEELLNEAKSGKIDYYCLHRRYHNVDLPVPKISRFPSLFNYLVFYFDIKRLLKAKKQILIFVPTIKFGKKLHLVLRSLIKNIRFVSSKSLDRNQTIASFAAKEFSVLITTSILERGITIPDIQVLVARANHNLFNKDTLIQISGRVGRVISASHGTIIFYGHPTKAMKQCISTIKELNALL
jgi:competence protein ComFA